MAVLEQAIIIKERISESCSDLSVMLHAIERYKRSKIQGEIVDVNAVILKACEVFSSWDEEILVTKLV